jgi:hypothetical protein
MRDISAPPIDYLLDRLFAFGIFLQEGRNIISRDERLPGDAQAEMMM